MAVSAFKSTTRRECAVGAGNESDTAYSGAMPLSKNRGHGRTQSLSDFSARYFSGSNDANSRHLDSLFQQGKQASARYQSDCDSESDADSTYSRHTYRSLQNAEIGAARKAALQNRTPKKQDKRRSPSVERSYKEIADFLSCIDDPNDADTEGPKQQHHPSPGGRRSILTRSNSEALFSRLAQPRRTDADVQSEAQSPHTQFARARRTVDAQSDSESIFSRLAKPRRKVDAQSDTEDVFSRLTLPRRRVDAHSDTEDVFSRLTHPRRQIDAQSDSESVFSRLTRSRQSLGPPRTGANAQNGLAKGTRAGALRRSTNQVGLSGSFRGRENDHSDAESLYSRGPNRSSRQTPSFGPSSAVAGRKKGTRAATLRRSSSQIEFSDNASLDGFMLPSSRALDDEFSPDEAFFEEFICKQQMQDDFAPHEEEPPSGHPEEEKTIRAVHTQNKEPRAQELDAISLYDAMRAEMRKAVSEIRSELVQKSASKDLVLPTPSVEEDDLRIAVPKEDDEEETSVSEVRREYAAKLEQSEKRAQDLWTQLAAEELRCLELVKFVKELIPAQAGAALQPMVPRSLPLRPMMGPEADQQLVSQCLDADAQRYFDECVSIAGLDIASANDASSCGAGPGYQESESGWSVKDMPFSPRKRNFSFAGDRNLAVLQPLKIFCAEFEQSSNKSFGKSNFFARTPVTEDGLVLPWLQWETKLDTASSSHSKAMRSQSGNLLESVDQPKDEQDTQLFHIPPGVSGLGCFGSDDLSSWKGGVVDFGHLRPVDRRYGVDVDMFLLQRSKMQSSIMGGRIHICGRIRW